MTIMSERRSQLASGETSPSLLALPLVTASIDFLLAAAAAGVAAVGRESLGFVNPVPEVDLGAGAMILPIGWVLVLTAMGTYHRTVLGAGTEEYRRVLGASLGTAGLIGVGSYLAHYELSRGFFLLLFGLGTPMLLLGRFAVRRGVHAARRRGRMRHRVLIVGSRGHVDEIVGVIRREAWLGYDVVGALTPASDGASETDIGLPVVGDVEQVTELVASASIDVVFFAGGAVESATQLRRVVWDLENSPVQVVVAPSVTDISSERVRIRPTGGLPLMHIEPPRWIKASRWGKRAFDMVSSAVLLVMLLPIMAFTAVQVKRFDGGPVLFRQTRIGRNGREFSCLKFRTMVVDAEALLSRLEHARENGGLFKMKDDPRITSPGRWLRRFSLDELPQLLNVLRGDMSLVGPRPPLPKEVATYQPDALRRLHVRPGLTGLWQVSGRSDLSWDETVRLDLYYVDNWSMMQDLSILARTVNAVLGSRGAY
ncbi:sugar transferase [Nocardioides sp. AX2bis]|uniref:sugar transferase n=1 Tax=Nocardioides sp. AX2bis TaxID=2653157 RepID=UPI0012F13801|nr:sugar transferase [Nocardioides sp. AX2bis]VXC52730.1 Polyprenyl glycosylphosphotransferase [Nocardioides sp. AX2bis]